MTDQCVTDQNLMKEISCLQKRIQELEKSEADRKPVEEALRESEEKYRLLAENAVEAIFVAQDYKLRFVNNKTEELIGYKKEQLISKPFIDFIHPDDRSLVLDRYIKRQQGVELPSKYSFRILHRTGKILWVELNAVVIFWEQRIATLNFLIDITERRRSEQEITALADIGRVIGSTLDIDDVYEQFASITRQLIPFDTLSVNLIDLQHNLFRIAYLSGLNLPGRVAGLDVPLKGTMTEYVMRRQKTKIFEASSAEDMGRQYPEINKILSIQAGFYSNMLIPLFSNDAIIGVLHFRSKKHNAYSDAVISLAERIGMQIAGAIANAQMFKNLSKTEMSLRESEGRFRALVEQAAVGVAEIDMGTGRFLIVNRRLCEMVGRTEAELLATTFQAITHPDDLHLHDEKTALLMAGKIGYYSLEKRYVRKDGTIICVNITVSPLWNPGEKPGRNMIVVEDITERKQAEQDLQQAHRQLTSLFNGARDAIFIVDIATGLILDANDEAALLLNLPRETLIGLHHSQLHPAEKADFHRKRFIERSQISNPDLVEAEVLTSDGRRISVEISARSIELSDGKRAMVAIFREITERKQAEDSLRKQANKLSSIFRAAPVGIGMVINRVIQEANDALCQMTGYSLEELLGRDARMLYPTQEDYDYVGQEKYRQIGEKRIGTVETRWKRKDGRIIDIILSSTPLDPDDLSKGVTFTALAITERKRAEKTLQRQNIYLESLNETALGLMRRTDLRDIFQAILDRAMRFFGTDEGWIFMYHFQEGVFEYKAAMGKRGYEIGSRVEADSGISAEVRRTEQTVLVDDYHAWPKRASGREYDMRRATVAIPLRYEGQLAGILGLSHHDAAKRFEDDDLAILERLAELASIALDNAQLYDRMKLELAERKQAEEENIRLVERLQRAEKMEALGQLAGGVAHDLNNVLGILSGYSELLLLEIPEGHRSKGYAEKILQSTEKGAAIIQDLLTLARRSVVVSEVINLNNILSGFFKAPVFEKMKDHHPRVTFRTDCDENLLNIKGSPVHLEKTLMNLVSNAAESISEKGEVTIRTESRYVDKAIQGYDEVKEGDYAVLTVSDTGMGIPAEEREKIFEPFYTKKTMGRSGTGLGLAIVWGTVKDHNGYIDVQSEVGQGTTFTLYFPVTREEAISKQQKMPMERYMGKGEFVLVVDDITEQRDVAAGLLTRLGYKVHVVSSGEEAVEYLKGKKVDILVLDMIMPPGMDGLETYQRVLEFNPKQKAIIVSGFSETERVKRAQKLGAGDYVKKPYVMEKIGVALRKELDKK